MTAEPPKHEADLPRSLQTSAPADEPPVPPVDLARKIIEGASTRALGWILEQHCTMQITETSMEVVFHGNNRMARELLHEDGTLRTLQQIVRSALGRELPVHLIDAPQADHETNHAAEASPPSDEQLFSLPQAPIVRETLELFGGRILDVRHRAVAREVKHRPIHEDELVGQEDVDDE